MGENEIEVRTKYQAGMQELVNLVKNASSKEKNKPSLYRTCYVYKSREGELMACSSNAYICAFVSLPPDFLPEGVWRLLSSSKESASFQKVNREFPDIDALIGKVGKKKPFVNVMLNAQLLYDLSKIVSNRHDDGVILTFHLDDKQKVDPHIPIAVQGNASSGMLMLMREGSGEIWEPGALNQYLKEERK